MFDGSLFYFYRLKKGVGLQYLDRWKEKKSWPVINIQTEHGTASRGIAWAWLVQ